MAAHVKTALEQIMEQKYPSSHLRGALQFSCWTEDLTMEEWAKFDDIVNHFTMTDNEKDAECKKLARKLFNKYVEEWLTLDMPATREEWRELKWGAK